MAKKNYDTNEYISFDTVYGDRQINLDIPRDCFDTEKCTVWLSMQDISDLCCSTVNFLKASRLMNGGVFDDRGDVMRFSHGNTQYDLSVAILLMTEYAPVIASRFFGFAVRKLCEIYLEDKTKGDIRLRDLPVKIDEMYVSLGKAQKAYDMMQKKITVMNDDINALKLASQKKTQNDAVINTTISTADDYDVASVIKEQNIDEVKESDKETDTVNGKTVHDNGFLTVIKFLRMEPFSNIIPLRGIADDSKLVTQIKSIMTQQANYIVRGQIGKELDICPYEATGLFNRLMDSWRSENPKSLASLCPNECERICKYFHYEKTYQFYRPDGVKYNCVLSYPYGTLREAMRTALRAHKFDDIIQTLRDIGIME